LAKYVKKQEKSDISEEISDHLLVGEAGLEPARPQ